jgi:glycosyltransferase involved in cell wall biosynthesis
VPSAQESFGGVYTEAWSMGKPVIGCPIPAVAEVIADGKDGLLSLQEPGALADAMLELLLQPGRAVALGEAGRRKVEARFTWAALGRRTEALYQQLMRTPGAGTLSTSDG